MLDHLIETYPTLQNCKQDIIDTRDLLCATFKQGNKLLTCGNTIVI